MANNPNKRGEVIRQKVAIQGFQLTCPLVFVGLMGAGKTSVGRRVAKKLGVPFVDADQEIEKAAGRAIADIFEDYGEEAFRDGERKVISRLLDSDPFVLATGGGAFMNKKTRAIIKQKALSIWLCADLDVLVERTSRRDTRPLLRNGDPARILGTLMKDREPIYAEADLRVDANAKTLDDTINKVLTALRQTPNKQGPSLETGT